MTDESEEPLLPSLLENRLAYKARLERILPPSITGTTASANDVAAAVAMTMVYVGAVGGVHPIRPSTVYWMSDAVTARTGDVERREYYSAAMRSRRAVDIVLEGWEANPAPNWYADTSREPIRDETLRVWIDNGAVEVKADVETTSSGARYTLAADFAALLDPTLTGADFEEAAAEWQATHLTTTGKARADRARRQSRAEHAIRVHLPGDSGIRDLHIGTSSELVRGVVEDFSATYLSDPTVIFISQSGEKVGVVDEDLLRRLGLPIDQQTLLPDLLMADLDPARDEVWLVEVVSTDGPITDARRDALLEWATEHGVREAQCRFLTAFTSRTAKPFKKAIPVLARGSFAWFLDEPDALLSWDDLHRP